MFRAVQKKGNQGTVHYSVTLAANTLILSKVFYEMSSAQTSHFSEKSTFLPHRGHKTTHPVPKPHETARMALENNCLLHISFLTIGLSVEVCRQSFRSNRVQGINKYVWNTASLTFAEFGIWSQGSCAAATK